MNSKFANSVVLITGGTGSFGRTIARKFLQLGVREVRIFSRDEKKQDDMRREFSSDKLKFYIGDVRDIKALNRLFAELIICFMPLLLSRFHRVNFILCKQFIPMCLEPKMSSNPALKLVLSV